MKIVLTHTQIQLYAWLQKQNSTLGYEAQTHSNILFFFFCYRHDNEDDDDNVDTTKNHHKNDKIEDWEKFPKNKISKSGEAK